jgi:ATP/maltotriose-dependent transcriptional regulator MalT/two-component SAPR family response regulator
MPDFDRVVRSKIVPPTRRVGLLRRPRLIDFLHERVNRKLLLISAAAGYGKTSLLTDFQQDTELPTCWYAMDGADSDPRTFIAHLAASVQERFPRVQFSEGGESGAQASMQALVNQIQSEIRDYFIILIDDFQYADPSDGVAELMNWFLDHQPDNCCLVLASRTIPDLPYLRLAAKQEVAGLGSDDLAFTAQEIQDYLELNHNLRIPSKEAEQLAEQTEGWITGILLSTHTLWKGLLRSMTGSAEQIFKYLAEEVLAGQPEELQSFLRSTSILKFMRPAFCDELLGINNSDNMLDDLEKSNLFTTRLSGEQKVYRYHSLFQEFLVGQFVPDQLDRKRELHQRAGQLLERDGRAEQSIEHYLQAKARQDALRVIISVMEPAYQSGRLVTLKRWFDALAPGVLEADPQACIMRGRIWRQEGEFDRALELYSLAGDIYQKLNDQTGRAEVRMREAMVYRFRGDLETAKKISEEVLAMPDSPVETMATAHRILGEFHHLAGDLSSAKSEFRRSLKLNQKADNDYHSASMLHALGTTARRMGNSLEADGHYRKALHLLERLGNRWRIADIKNNIGVGHHYQGEYEKALEILAEALDEARDVGHTHTEALVSASLGDIHFELGEMAKAQEYFQRSLEGSRESKDIALEVYVLCALANLHRVDEAWDEAHALLEEAKQVSEQRESGYLQGLIGLVLGMLCVAQDRQEEAKSETAKAVDLLEKAGARREYARALLWQANAHYLSGEAEQALEQLKQAVSVSKEIAHPHLLVPDGRRVLPMLEALKDRKFEDLEKLLIRIHQFTLTTLTRPEEIAIGEPRLEITALGTSTVKVNGEIVPRTSWGGPLVKELFFYLVEHGPARRERILHAFWPNYSTAKAKSVFHATLYRMRRVLPNDAIQYLREHDQYTFNRQSDFWYDVLAFESMLERAQAGGDGSDELFEQAIGVYRGEFLANVYSDWCLERRQNLQRLFVDALSRTAQLKNQGGKHDQAVELYRRALSEEHYREDLLRELIRVLASMGQTAEAIMHFNAYSKRLEDEGMLGPSRETVQVIEAIRGKVNVT